MNNITITYGSTTQSIQDWGFTYCRLRLRSRAASVLILDTAGGDPTADAAIPYDGQITVQITMGDTSTYTWVGRRVKFNAKAYPQAPATSMQFEDVWTDLMLTTFQHYWSMSDGAGSVENKYFSRLMLFQDISAGPGSDWAYLTADAQIKQIIDFAQEQCGLGVQYGEVDPVWNMPVFQVKALSCAECLQLVLKLMPDMVTSIDYSTTLDSSPAPTINFLQRQNCTPITLPFAGTDAYGRNHKQSDITPRPDLQVPSVNIQYQITGTYDGSNYDDLGTDNYPLTSTGLVKRALVFPCDMRGPSNTIVKATLHTVAIDPTTTTFWQTEKQDLNSPDIVEVGTTINGGSGHPDGITIIDGANETVSLTDYPNKLLPSGGNPASWMKDHDGDVIEGVPVTITATLAYDKRYPIPGTSNSIKTHQNDKHVVTARIVLTNADAGTNTYSTLGSEDSGDPIPESLAYFMWCSINNIAVNCVDGTATPPDTAPDITAPENLQWEGEHQIVEDTIYSIITPANTLNISGGNTDWASMNAAIYAVDYDFFKGYTNIQFGPHKHLQAAEYFEMVMAFRYRSVWNNPSLRNNGAQSASGTDLGSQSPKENTTHGLPQQPVTSTVAPVSGDTSSTVVIQHNAAAGGGQIVVQTVTSAGETDTTEPQVQLAQNNLGTVDDEDDTGRVAKWRTIVVLDTDGNPQEVQAACSDFEDTDVTISGGALKYYINTVSSHPDIYADYFIAKTYPISTTADFVSGDTTFTVASATGITVGMFITSSAYVPVNTTVTSVSGTTIGCSNAITGNITGEAVSFYGLVRIAKVYELRTSGTYGITSEEIDGNTWDYAYDASSPYTFVSRYATATVDGNDLEEYQVICPRYIAGREIWCTPGDTDGLVSVADTISATPGAAITLLDENRGSHEWCCAADQSGYEG